MRFAVILLLAFCIQFASADSRVQIIDKVTGEPVVGATITSGDFRITTDAEGCAVLPESSGEFVLEHPGYHKYAFSTAGFREVLATIRSSEPVRAKIFISPRIYTTDEYTVTTTRFHTLREDLPQAITDISPKTLAFHNPQTSADALGSTGQVFVQKSQLGGGSPMLRGFAANSVLMVVDGVRMNNAIFRSGNLQNIIQIDPSSLERTSIFFGPGSVQFGSDALGGVMNFKTFDPVPARGDKLSVSGSAFARTASANFEKTSHANVSLNRGRVASYTSLTYSDFDDLRTGSVRSDD
ncbi:TonB-dependent receptor, partial [candidate division KSB1 bacterium]